MIAEEVAVVQTEMKTGDVLTGIVRLVQLLVAVLAVEAEVHHLDDQGMTSEEVIAMTEVVEVTEIVVIAVIENVATVVAAIVVLLGATAGTNSEDRVPLSCIEERDKIVKKRENAQVQE
jgi:hypothetical protein